MKMGKFFTSHSNTAWEVLQLVATVDTPPPPMGSPAAMMSIKSYGGYKATPPPHKKEETLPRR